MYDIVNKNKSNIAWIGKCKCNNDVTYKGVTVIK